MIEDLDHLPEGATLEADLCIVGAGAAGLLIAQNLCNCGLAVVLLESGSWATDEETSRLSEGLTVPDAFRGLQAGRSRRFGGTTTLWGGQCIRFDPVDFERRAWVPRSGWPINAAELASYYDDAETVLGIKPDEVEAPVWDRFGLATIAYDPAALNTVHGVFIRQPDLGKRFRAALKAARSVRVILHATVQRIATNSYGTQVGDIEIASLHGRRCTVRARRVVLCAGAIENARLLLLSDMTIPAGLGNDYDLVGRFLQDHPCGQAATIRTEAPRVLQDHYNMLYGRGARYLPKIALAEAAQRGKELLNCVGRLAYEYDGTSGTRALLDLAADLRHRRRPSLRRGMSRICWGLPDIVESLWRVGAKGLSPAPRPSRIVLEVFSEQAPNPDSRITLAPATDRFGLRQVSVDWRLDALTGRTIRSFTRLVGREFERLGLGVLQEAAWLAKAVPPWPDVVDSYHPAGTTRMALHPAQGVVDSNCQVFGVHGLYVAGSAVFPTSGAANPTLTIAALALRLAERLRAEFAEDAARRLTVTSHVLVRPA